MNRKEFLAVVISAALGLSGAPVYASESAAFSDGEVQEYGAEEEKQEKFSYFRQRSWKWDIAQVL